MKRFFKIFGIANVVLALGLIIAGAILPGKFSLVGFFSTIPILLSLTSGALILDMDKIEADEEKDTSEQQEDKESLIYKKESLFNSSITKDKIENLNNIKDIRLGGDFMENTINSKAEENKLIVAVRKKLELLDNSLETKAKEKAFWENEYKKVNGRSLSMGATRRSALPRGLEFNKEDISLIEMIRKKLAKIDEDIKFTRWLTNAYEENDGKSLAIKGTRRTSLPEGYSGKVTSETLDCKE